MDKMSILLLSLFTIILVLSPEAVTVYGQEPGPQLKVDLSQLSDKLSLVGNETLIQWLSDVQNKFRTGLASKETHDLFMTALTKSEKWGNVSQECISSTVFLFEDLTKKKPIFAPQVLDAIGKFPSGLLYGNVAWLGSYQQCLDVNIPYKNITYFRADYCSIAINTSIIPTADIHIGVCVPYVCSTDDVVSLSNLLLGVLNVSGTHIDYGKCDKDVYVRTYSNGDIAAITILCVFGLLLLIGTLYDIITLYIHMYRTPNPDHDMLIPPVVEDGALNSGLISATREDDDLLRTVVEIKPNKKTDNRSHGLMGQIMMCFSVIHNGAKILSTEQRSGQLASLNGMRVISMWWVILGHTFLFSSYAIDNGVGAYKIIARRSFNVVINGTYSVDTFFFISGLLVCYLTMKELKKSRERGDSLTDQVKFWILFYVHRFWRLTPMYMMLLMIFTTIYYYIPAGPVYLGSPPAAQNPCANYWWTNLLYINNFVPTNLNDQCFGWGWYLANDMQFYWISPLILITLHLKRVVGIAIAVTMILACTLTRALIAHTHNLTPFSDVTNGGYDDNLYLKPYTRIHVYIVGMMVGYILYLKPNMKIRWRYQFVGWALAIGAGEAIVYGLTEYYAGRAQITHAVGVLYLGFARLGWGLALAWVALVTCTGNSPEWSTLLGWRAWAPLSRLTYGAYLIHPIVMFSVLMNRRTMIHFSDLELVYIYIGNLVLSYAGAFIASLVFESPFMGLEKIIFKRKTD